MHACHVDNNNKSSPENIPQVQGSTNIGSGKEYTHRELGWGWSGIINSKYLNIQDQKPSLKDFAGESATHFSFYIFFLLFLS